MTDVWWKQGGSYMFFWKSRKVDDRRKAGVGLAIYNTLVSKLAELPYGINDRLMTL